MPRRGLGRGRRVVRGAVGAVRPRVGGLGDGAGGGVVALLRLVRAQAVVLTARRGRGVDADPLGRDVVVLVVRGRAEGDHGAEDRDEERARSGGHQVAPGAGDQPPRDPCRLAAGAPEPGGSASTVTVSPDSAVAEKAAGTPPGGDIDSS